MKSKNYRNLIFSVTLSSAVLANAQLKAGDNMTTITPPAAPKKTHETKLHDRTLKDDYFWLREKGSPEVTKYLEAENKYTNSWLSKHKKLENNLFKEIVSKIREDDESPHFQKGTYMYGAEIKKGEQYAKHFRYQVGKPKQKKVYFDENREAKGKAFFSLGGSSVSPSEDLLIYAKDTVGFREYQLFIRDLKTGKDSQMLAEKIGSFAWTADSKAILYTVEDAAKRQHKVFKHLLGADPKVATEIFQEKDERFNVSVSSSLDKESIFITIGSHTMSEVRYAPADLSKPFEVILPRKDNVEYGVSLRDGLFYVMANDKSPSFRIATLEQKQMGKWSKLKNFMKPEKGAVLTDFDLFKNHMVISERANGLEQLLVYSFADKSMKPMKFPEVTYSLGGGSNYLYDTNLFRFSYSSMVSPPTIFDVNLDTLALTTVQEKTPPGKFDKTLYQTERVITTARDGTKIPVSLVYKKSMFKKGESPSLISAYGSYGYPSDARFESSAFPLLDRGFVLATIHIRGGGEFGKPWHDDGKMFKKMNTFYDFIDATKSLIDTKYISQQNIFIEGGSAGGLLMGAVTNLEPSLFRGVLSHVPFVDVINTMLDESMPLTVGEFEEWGNPKKKKDFQYISTYSPYENLRKGDYPAIWIRTGLHDSQVMYWEPAKYTAKLRTLKTDKNPLFMLIDMKSGHGGASGRYDSYRERAQDFVFILENLAN